MTSVDALLDNIVWHALTGAQAHLARGDGGARRYARGFSPIVGFADPAHPDLAALASHCAPDEHFYCEGWDGPVPPGWKVEMETTLLKMIWDAPPPAADGAPDAVALTGAHAADAQALVDRTQPGPFGPRTIEMGEYFGLYQDGRLVAMAGERFHAGALREVSGVCTHPDYQGRGLARRLMLKLVGRQIARGETPFLHVLRDNAVARDLYRRMGFRVYHERVTRVLSLA